VPEGKVQVDLVLVAASDPLAGHVSSVFQVRHDCRRGPFRQVSGFSEFPDQCLRVAGDLYQDVAVGRQQRP
jgi:hypothetical protein